jgi:hypothetical protein
MRNLVRGAVACAMLLIGMSSPARADIIFFFTPGDVQPEENLLFNDDLILTGTTVQGITNQTGTIFDLTGLETLQAVSAGQARVETLDNGFAWLLFEANQAGLLFGEFEANLNVYSPPGPSPTGTVTVWVTNNFGDVESASYGVGAGQNFFGLRAVDPQLIRSILITSTVDLADIRQIRVGGIETPNGGGNGEVPETGSLLLFGMGLLAAGRHFRRSRTRNA